MGHALSFTPMDFGDAFPLATSSQHLASSSLDLLLSPESVLGKLNPETPDWLRTIVWIDFRLAVTFFVVSPLALLIWSAIGCRATTTPSLSTDAVLRIVAGYWQASALLLITVLLNIESSAVGAVTGAVAQGMIYASLNWWESLNKEAAAEQEESALSQTFTLWRTVASGVAGVGVAVQLPFLKCSLAEQGGLAKDPYCAAWLEPPQTAAALLGIAPEQVELLANATLAIYVAYLIYYVAIPLREIGRDGRRPRSSFTFVEPLIALGFLEKEDSS